MAVEEGEVVRSSIMPLKQRRAMSRYEVRHWGREVRYSICEWSCGR